MKMRRKRESRLRVVFNRKDLIKRLMSTAVGSASTSRYPSLRLQAAIRARTLCVSGVLSHRLFFGSTLTSRSWLPLTNVCGLFGDQLASRYEFMKSFCCCMLNITCDTRAHYTFRAFSSNGSAAAASELICLRVSPRLQTWVDFISLAEVWACVTITAILGHCTECWLFQSLCCKAEYSELLWICPLFPHFRSSSEQFDGFDALCFHTGREGTDAVLSLGRLILDSYRVFMMDVWRVDKVAPV